MAAIKAVNIIYVVLVVKTVLICYHHRPIL
jgi:hypothetical protein